jgi:hypothetical protein
MRKFINRPQNVVEDMLQGLAVLHPASARLAGHTVMVRADAERSRDHRYHTRRGPDISGFNQLIALMLHE